VAGTVVITVAGKKAIEYIREGDLVLSEDPDTGDITYKKVLETYINETSELIHLNIDGEEIVTTPAHPFYVKEKGFILAGDLLEGSILVDSEGNELHLKIKRWEHLQSPVPVYNFAVEDFHTYFVGDNEVLVHNNCGVEPPTSLKSGEADTYVYLGMKDGAATYVGITKDIARRQFQHGERFDYLLQLSNALTRREARAIEQYLIEICPHYSNMINSISPYRNWYNDAIKYGAEWVAHNLLH
jgi:hypothetical protein